MYTCMITKDFERICFTDVRTSNWALTEIPVRMMGHKREGIGGEKDAL